MINLGSMLGQKIGPSQFKPYVKRKYLLTREADFNMWKDDLNNELDHYGLLDVVDSNATVLKDYSAPET